ncbi:hypothetical protein LINGRAHAP2_LOCUS31915 [Linum grandiflorum]
MAPPKHHRRKTVAAGSSRCVSKKVPPPVNDSDDDFQISIGSRRRTRIFDINNADLDNSKVASSSLKLKNKPDWWETTWKARDGNVWDMSQSLEDILHQEFDRRVAFCKFQLGSYSKLYKDVVTSFKVYDWSLSSASY